PAGGRFPTGLSSGCAAGGGATGCDGGVDVCVPGGGGGAVTTAGLFHGPKIQAPAPSSAIATMPPTYASARDFLRAVTVTDAVALAPSHVQVIVAEPGCIAVTRPSSE